MFNKARLLFIYSVVPALILMGPTSVLAELNKTAIIDQNDVAYNGVGANDIQTYFASSGSQLASYTIPDTYEVYYPIGQGQWDKVAVPQQWQSNLELEVYHGKTIAQMVAEWSSTSKADRVPGSPGKINPLIVLATMDKESGAITGGAKSDIISNRPITLSWLMGYGFNGKMADCVASGACDTNNDGTVDATDIDYYRQRALWYGGPGQQIAEATASLKRWTTSPEVMNSCEEMTWNRMSIGGECLNLQNSISYALYRYTPNFSGNTLFATIYAKLKSVFPYPPLILPDENDNDISAYSTNTYSGGIDLVGTKATNNQAWFQDQLLADFGKTTWKLHIEPSPGKYDYKVEYRRANGSTINWKPFHVFRHKVGDINGDSSVDIQDLSVLSQYWGHTDPPNPMANLNASVDSEINILDLSLMAANYGG